jgi:hypothetical protein
VRGLTEEVEILAGDAAARLSGALDWPAAPALVRARISVTPDGSAKPIELARALDLAGGEAPGAPPVPPGGNATRLPAGPPQAPARCVLARLGFVGADLALMADVPLVALKRDAVLRAN